VYSLELSYACAHILSLSSKLCRKSCLLLYLRSNVLNVRQNVPTTLPRLAYKFTPGSPGRCSRARLPVCALLNSDPSSARVSHPPTYTLQGNLLCACARRCSPHVLITHTVNHTHSTRTEHTHAYTLTYPVTLHSLDARTCCLSLSLSCTHTLSLSRAHSYTLPPSLTSLAFRLSSCVSLLRVEQAGGTPLSLCDSAQRALHSGVGRTHTRLCVATRRSLACAILRTTRIPTLCCE
jgi:hypothetical protein